MHVLSNNKISVELEVMCKNSVGLLFCVRTPISSLQRPIQPQSGLYHIRPANTNLPLGLTYESAKIYICHYCGIKHINP